MPIDPTGVAGPSAWSLSLNGPDSVEFNITVWGANAPTEADADDAVQSFVNYISDWPDLAVLTYANKQTSRVHAVTPDP